MTQTNHPFLSLKEGRWFKLICGASYQNLPAIRNLALAYTLAGADCVDVAADPAVVAAVQEAFQGAAQWRKHQSRGDGETGGDPWLMVSFCDGEDPHFRKAVFDPAHCPADCPRPCELICPADAIAMTPVAIGVLESRCYGCGRCLPVCPIQTIHTRSTAVSPAAIAPELLPQVDAIEIHTQINREEAFLALWHQLQPWVGHLKLLAISCPDGEGVIPYLWRLYEALQPLPIPLIWQTDGRPMSGDIGDGTTHATMRLGQKVLAQGPPGFVQLAGGTNGYTVPKLHQLGWLRQKTKIAQETAIAQGSRPRFGGVAYGSYARRLLSEVLEADATDSSATAPGNRRPFKLEEHPDQLQHAIAIAQHLMLPLKRPAEFLARFPVECPVRGIGPPLPHG